MSERSNDVEASGGKPEDANREHLRRLQRQRQGRVAKAIVILVIVGLLVVFVIQNSDRVPIDFIFVTRNARLIYVLLVTALLGGIAGYLIGRPGKKTRLHQDDEKGDEG